MLKSLKQPKKIIKEYSNKNKITIRSNIDGHYSLKADTDCIFEQGIYYEVLGSPELYVLKYETNKLTGETRPSLCRDVLKENKYDVDNIIRGYSKLVDFELVKCVNLEDFTKVKVEEINELEGIKTKVKERYELNGVPFAIGKLNIGQMVRYKDTVVVITELIKPNKKAGETLTKIIGTEISRVQFESVYRLYTGWASTLKLYGEYIDVGDAWLKQAYLFKEGIITHL